MVNKTLIRNVEIVNEGLSQRGSILIANDRIENIFPGEAPAVGNAQVTGTGTLEIMHNGESFKTVTEAYGQQTFRFYSSLALEQLTFSYTPGESDTGAALLSSFAVDDGLMIILR